jgi:hypothetical protein
VQGQGFYQNKPDFITTDATNFSLVLGTVSYTRNELLRIYAQPVSKNGLISLAQQLITAKLNVRTGATTTPEVLAAIADADRLINNLVVPPIGSGSLSTKSTSNLVNILTRYNEGRIQGVSRCR